VVSKSTAPQADAPKLADQVDAGVAVEETTAVEATDVATDDNKEG